MLLNVNDITNLKKIIEFFPDGILVLNSYQKIILANAEAERIFGEEEQALKKNHLKDLFFSDNNFFEQELSNKNYRPGEAYEFYARRSDGSSIFTNVTFKKIEDNYILCAVRDLTHVHQFANEKLSVIISSSEDAIITKDLHGKILSWNKSAEKMFGYTANEAIGKSINIIIPPEKINEEEEILAHIKEKQPEHLETYRIRKDGSLVNVSVTISPLNNKYGKVIGAVKIARDNTEQVKMLHHLENQNKRLEEFSRVIAHDFRSPISNMQSLLYFYKTEKDFDTRDLYISKLNDCIAGLNETFEDLLDVLYAQDEEKKTELVRFDKTLDKVIVTCENEIKETNAEIISDFSAAESFYYIKTYLESILQNLISNTLKYCYPNRKPVIYVKTEKLQNQITLSVSDNGLGIDLKRYGDKLFGFHETFHNHPKAKGIGLYLVKTQVEAMGGKIMVESEVNKGTTFKILF